MCLRLVKQFLWVRPWRWGSFDVSHYIFHHVHARIRGDSPWESCKENRETATHRSNFIVQFFMARTPNYQHKENCNTQAVLLEVCICYLSLQHSLALVGLQPHDAQEACIREDTYTCTKLPTRWNYRHVYLLCTLMYVDSATTSNTGGFTRNTYYLHFPLKICREMMQQTWGNVQNINQKKPWQLD